MLEKTLAYLMILMFSREAPGIMKDTPKMEARRQEITQLAKIHAEVAAPGHLVDPQTDAAILAAVSWFESRHMLHPQDGDKRYSPSHDKIVGTVVGPMQVSKAAPQIVPTWPTEIGQKYQGLTVEKMRDPKTNVELAYDILRMWKDQCGGSPGVWITAYGWGRCPGKSGGLSVRTVDWEGKRRCKLATQTMIRMEKAARQDPQFTYTVPSGWYCGHEVGVQAVSTQATQTNPITPWLFDLAMAYASPSRAHQFPGWEESVLERKTRYKQIVQDIYDVVFDENERPIPGMSRTRTAAYMLALGIGESGLDPDTDRGPCYRDKGWWRRCDAGQAASMWQVKIGKGFLFTRNQKRVWMKDLFADRKVALRIALRAVRGSFWACRKFEPKHRLAVYGSGSCTNKAGMVGSAKRYELATKLWGHTKIPSLVPPPKVEAKKAKPKKTEAREALRKQLQPVDKRVARGASPDKKAAP